MPPNGPWTLWVNENYTDASGNFYVAGQQIGAAMITVDTNIITYVEICAHPGVAPYTAQSGVCGGGETNYGPCVTTPATTYY